jgi:hypothetical protein
MAIMSSSRFTDDIGGTRLAAEPVLSLSDELVLQNFLPILRTRPDDSLLLNAIMLTFSFALATGNFNKECLEYQSATLSSVRERIFSPNKATMESTLGAILLLAGVEVSLKPRLFLIIAKMF